MTLEKQHSIVDPELYSCDPWQYGDEASLYSIAEDSREDRASEFTPSHPQQLKQDGLNCSPGNGVLLPSQRKRAIEDLSVRGFGIEICYDEDNNASEDLTKASDDQLFYPNRRRRLCTVFSAACLICALLVGIVLSVTLTQLDRNQSRDSFVDITTATEEDGAENPTVTEDDPVDDPVITENPSQSPSTDTKYELAENFVFNSINQCSGTSTFFDTTTPQGQVFESLVNEVYDNAETSTDGSGSIAFDELHSAEYLQEKYALSILYISTNGGSWENSDNWISASEPCDDWYGVDCESSSLQASCAVTGLTLDSNNLSGSLPDELCCMPCLEHIGMSNNMIGGNVLMCLVEIPTLQTIDFVNNVFGQGATTATVRSIQP